MFDPFHFYFPLSFVICCILICYPFGEICICMNGISNTVISNCLFFRTIEFYPAKVHYTRIPPSSL